MKNKDWKLIAASLGLIIPMSILASETPSKTTLHEGKDVPSVISNEVRDRIMNFQQTAPQASDELFPVHTNSHTNINYKHTDFHSNYAHSNNHTNKTNTNTCPATHTDTHSNVDGMNSHSDYGKSNHENHHTDIVC